MATKKKKAKKNAGRHSFRKTKKREGKMAKSRKRLGVSKGQVRAHRKARGTVENPAMKRTPKGWVKASAIKIVRRGGKRVLLVKK
jgi:hypothetical protein